MEMETLFVDVILPLAVPNLYTYRVPRELAEYIGPGQRVIVQFGKNKFYTAIIKNIHTEVPDYRTKYIHSLLDETPIITQEQLKLWDWISAYYMCYLGEVYIAALPSSLSLNSQTKIMAYPDAAINFDELNDKEVKIIEALEINDKMSFTDIENVLGIKTVQPTIKSLIEKRYIIAEEELKHRYKPKLKTFVRLTDYATDDENLKNIMDKLSKRAFKQLEVLMLYCQMAEVYSENPKEIGKIELQKRAGVSASVINQLVEKEILEFYDIEINRLEDYNHTDTITFELSPLQQTAYESMQKQLEEKSTVLLYGVTGSGKTNLYLDAIQEVLNKGEQVLYLLPEIALTTQMITRLQKRFGDQVGVYHSKFNQNERAELWFDLLKKDASKYKLIIGARSSLFLPFHKLGLIIVDEEHETSFKQFDPAPRYNARDTSLVLANIYKAKVILGTATPSVETMWNAKKGNYGYVELNERYGGVMMPEILCADLKDALKKKEMHSHFSKFLMQNIEATLENKEQIILFQNRRGYAPTTQCKTCGWVPECDQCDISLTYHKNEHQLRCHYCGTSSLPPKECKACGSTHLSYLSFGTQKIEEELPLLFPNVKVQRMDYDSTRNKHAYRDIIERFENKEIDVLIGTQMVTKGLDFDNVGLVGILSADSLLHYPDFRAFERAYQLMSQVSGRAGRKKKRGKVIIQTFQPDHWVVQNVIKHDYMSIYNQEILERKNFHYPPFVRLVKIGLKSKNESRVDYVAQQLAYILKQKLGARVLGPETPQVSKVKNQFYRHITVKIERKINSDKVKSLIQETTQDILTLPNNKNIRFYFDVDPV